MSCEARVAAAAVAQLGPEDGRASCRLAAPSRRAAAVVGNHTPAASAVSAVEGLHATMVWSVPDAFGFAIVGFCSCRMATSEMRRANSSFCSDLESLLRIHGLTSAAAARGARLGCRAP
eukprot:1468514-Prymnesium_polylepis.1